MNLKNLQLVNILNKQFLLKITFKSYNDKHFLFNLPHVDLVQIRDKAKGTFYLN